MSDPKKSDYWAITCTKQVIEKITFEERITAEEAKERFEDGDIDDCLDTEELSIISVDKLEPIGD